MSLSTSVSVQVETATALRASPALPVLKLDEEHFVAAAGVAVFAVHGTRIVHVNDALVRLTGYSRARLLGADLTRFIAPEQRHLVAARAHARQRGDDEPGRYELSILHRDGRKLWLEVQVNLLRQAGQTFSVGVGYDITTRKRAEQLLGERNQELEEITAALAHDLRGPLQAIDGFGRLLQDDPSGQLDDAGRQQVDRILGAGRQMNGLVEKLLELSQASGAELQREPIALSALVAAEVRDLASQHGDPDHELLIEPAVQVRGDPGLLRLALINLIDNAFKFALGGRPRIEFGTVEIDGVATCFLRDSGVGFDMARAARLFDPFQRLDSGRSVEGYGIGLATVRRIVERHGGRIWAESAPGEGATFFFTLNS